MRREQPLLRTQLLEWLLIPLFLLLAADGALSYWVALSFSQRAYDRSLVEIAHDLSTHLSWNTGRPQLDLPEAARRILLADPQDRIYFGIVAADGSLVGGRSIPDVDAPARDARATGEEFYVATIDEMPVRVVRLAVNVAAANQRPGAVIYVAETERKRTELAREILLSVLAPQALLILISGLVVWIGVAHGLAPLRRLQAAIASRAQRDFSPVPDDQVPGEVRPLLRAINELLARLDRALTEQRRFISDAAHQLKTPVAATQAQLELAVRETDPGRMIDSVNRSLSALGRLDRLVAQLLSLARNEPEASSAVILAPLDLNSLALEAASSWVPEALKKRIDLGFESAERPVTISGEAVRLRELLDNLLDNAVAYSRKDGRVTVRVSATPSPAVAVSDDAPCIPEAERERIFERFYRPPGTPREGSGLGLAIAREIASIHGARIDVRAGGEGHGNSFIVTFPQAAARD